MAKTTKQNNDAVILGLKQQIEAKKALLKKSDKFTPITNCNLVLDNERFNIHILDKPTLIHLISKLTSLKKVSDELGLTEGYDIAGFNISDWVADLTAKYTNLDKKLEQMRLKNWEDELHDLLTSDKKTELRISDIAKNI